VVNYTFVYRCEMKAIQDTIYYRSLSQGRTDVEVWDDRFSEDGWDYFSIVAFSQGTAKKLAYIRVKSGQLQRRIYDENGDDHWVEVA